MKALVLGATGHIGAHVVRALVAEGHTVRAAYRSEKHLGVLEGLPVEKIRVDLADDGGSLRQALDGVEWVFHAAGFYPPMTGDRRESVRIGVETARRFFETVRGFPVKRIVFTSSASTIRRMKGRLSTEEDADSWPPAKPRPLYPTVKIAMEQEALKAAESGLPVVVVNPTLCVGEYDAHAFSGQAVLAYASWRIPITFRYDINAVYTGDVGVGHVRAAEKGRIGQRYLLAGRNIELKEFAALAASAAGVKAFRLHLPVGGSGRGIDGSKAVRELGMPQTPIEEAVKRSVNWFRENGYIKK